MLSEQSRLIAKAEKDLQKIREGLKEAEKILKNLIKHANRLDLDLSRAKKSRPSAMLEKERGYIHEDSGGLLSTSSPVVCSSLG